MNFGKRLAQLRKQRGLTQILLASQVGVHIAQLRNYEASRSQPTLEVIRKLAIALAISADELIFDQAERLPSISDVDLIKSWQRLEQLPLEERNAIKLIVDAVLLRHTINSFNSNS